MRRIRSFRSISILLIMILLFCGIFTSCSTATPAQITGSPDSSADSSLDSSSDGSSSMTSDTSSDNSSDGASSEAPSSSGSPDSSTSSGSSLSEPDPTPDPVLYRYIIDGFANLRVEPSSESAIIKELVYGTRIRYVADSGAWTQVITQDEEYGYVFSSLLSSYEPDPSDKPVVEVRKLLKWPSEFSVSGFYDALIGSYEGRFAGQGYMPLKGITVILDPGHGGRDGGAVYTSSSGKSVLEKKINLEIALKAAADLESMGAEVVLTRDGDSFVGLYARSAIINLLILNRHRKILASSGLDTTETDRLIASMESVIEQNSDSESGSSRGIMKGLGACEELRTVFDISAEHKDIVVVSLHCNSVAGASYVNGLEVYYGTSSKIYAAESILLPNELKTNPLNPSYQAYDDSSRLNLASAILDNLKKETEFELRGNHGLYQANFCMLRENNLASVLVEMGYISNSGDRAFLTDPAGQKRISYAIAYGIYEYFCVG